PERWTSTFRSFCGPASWNWVQPDGSSPSITDNVPSLRRQCGTSFIIAACVCWVFDGRACANACAGTASTAAALSAMSVLCMSCPPIRPRNELRAFTGLGNDGAARASPDRLLAGGGMTDISKIRNFSIIAHIDHGKSTLADRLIQATGGLSEREMSGNAQVLDNMDIERERGITIKAQTVRLEWQGYELNLMDTPGHVDFAYEVSRSLAACEGALLVVDAAQGVEAQTLANVYQSIEHDHEIVPVINKIDLPAADAEGVRQEIEEIIGLDASGAVLASAKTGVGIEQLSELGPGEIGFITAQIKEVAETRVGDTITDARRPAAAPLPGFKLVQPVVFCGLFPVDANDFEKLRDSLYKLRLNDASFSFEMETSAALGFGFRCGFLGLLHLEIIQERLTREYDLDLITTAPSVIY